MIDAHHHLWDPGRGDYGWLAPGSPLHRAFRPSDLAPELQAAGIDGTIVVQAAPTPQETDYLLRLARSTDWILGVVGWVDLAAPDAPGEVERRAGDPLVVGVRPMLQDLADRRWILARAPQPALDALQRRGLVFDALVRADQLPVVATLAWRYPELPIVLDHAGKPPFGDAAAMGAWRRDLASVAARPNVSCKLSGLATELPQGAPADILDACIDTLAEEFGPERLIWASDWPVSTQAVAYGDWLARCRLRIARRWPRHVAAIFGDNARRVYRLPQPAAAWKDAT